MQTLGHGHLAMADCSNIDPFETAGEPQLGAVVLRLEGSPPSNNQGQQRPQSRSDPCRQAAHLRPPPPEHRTLKRPPTGGRLSGL
jgi:hypothetical protein